MRQLITRIDDRLHQKLKARAAKLDQSVNALVTELLESALAGDDERETVRARAKAADLVVTPRPDRRPPSRDSAIASTRGAGLAASRALADDRARR